MSFVDELKGIQVTEEEAKQRRLQLKLAERKERQEKYIKEILRLCKEAAKNGNEWIVWSNHYDTSSFGHPSYDEGRIDRLDLVEELKREEYGFTEIFAKTKDFHSEYDSDKDYYLYIYIAWSKEGARLAHKWAKDSEPKEGCYIATAVYNSYNCPQVWTLRRYRDEVLAANWYGRAFIRVYYVVSPILVKWFGNFAWFNTMWKKLLDSLVAKLQLIGVEPTPYQDVNWRKKHKKHQ